MLLMANIVELMELSPENTIRLDKIKEIVKNKWITKREPIVPFTDHGEKHSRKIEEILIQLLCLNDEKKRTKFNKKFTDNEKFLLLAAVWLHDIGMCPTLCLPGDKDTYDTKCFDTEEGMKKAEQWDNYVRDTHNIRSARFVRLPDGLKKELGINPENEDNWLTDEEYDYLSTICYFHRRSDPIPYQYDKIRIIIAYIRLADALHIPDRNPTKKIETYLAHGMDPVAKYHWFKSFFIDYAGPSKYENWKLIVKFKKPLKWGGDPESAMNPLKEVILEELKDELDAIKEILVNGHYKYDLPAYTEVEHYFDEIYLEDDEISNLKELLGIIELYNPVVSPNAGKMIDTVLNQIERVISLHTINLAELENCKKQLDGYLKDTLIKILIKERPCHAYLHNLKDELKKYIADCPTKKSNWKSKKEIEKINLMVCWITDIKDMIKALKWWRNQIKVHLQEKFIKTVVNKLENREKFAIFLYGYSGSVVQALNGLPDKIKNEIEIFIPECSTKTKHRYNNRLIYSDGVQYFSELKKIGIKNLFLVPDAVASNLFRPYDKLEVSDRKKNIKLRKRVDFVLFGANGIDMNSGEVYHSLGHLAMADMAITYNIPVYVIAEGLKLRKKMTKTPLNQRKGPWYPTDLIYSNLINEETTYNPREDVVPFDKVCGIITENGVVINSDIMKNCTPEGDLFVTSNQSNYKGRELKKISLTINDIIMKYCETHHCETFHRKKKKIEAGRKKSAELI